jgi:hypothetical protein
MKFKIIKIDKSEWVSFVLTLIATLMGVLIAIWLTNSGIIKKEKNDTIKLLHTAKLILVNTDTHSRGLNNFILELEKDTVNNNATSIQLTKSTNPIPYPDLLETIISNELISKNISEYSHNYIYSSLINLRKLAKYETADYYQKSLKEMIFLLNLEIEHQKGEINLKDLESKMEVKKYL